MSPRKPKDPNKTPQPQRLSSGKLKERGWTEGLISQFLGKPDATTTNPIYKSAAPMRLWNLDRIEAAEASAAFQEAKTQASKRQVSAQKAVQTKTELTLKLARELPIHVENLSLSQLSKEALRHYIELKLDREEYHYADAKFLPWGSPDPFRDRLCVNYLRHQATPYHENLDQLFGKTGIGQAYLLLWQRITEAICKAYPSLAAEAKRQYHERSSNFGDAQTALGDS